MFHWVMSLLIFVTIVFAVCSFWTGISVGVNRHLLCFWRRLGIFASVSGSFGYVCLILMWWSDIGWQYITEFEAVAWMINHLMVFTALTMYHAEVLKHLGFKTFRESRENAAAAYYHRINTTCARYS